jgi:tetratricopeptide (TPR) repeat protein
MFTDVAGSTTLRTTLGDDEADKLFRAHDDIVRGCIAGNHGFDQGAALGDGFLAVFASTRRAVAAAVEIQRALDSFNRSRAGSPIQVRIGINTGEVSWKDGQPFGEAVHAASRVCSAAGNGQILLSDVTRQLAGTIPDLSFLDTGEHDLKGFPHPWRLWDVVWVRETATMPKQVFVARENEMTGLRRALADALNGTGSFVLVGGEPGVGKTTLVKELIREAESQGALALFGRCYESEGAPPYSPFVEMLGKALSVMPAEMVREDMSDDAPEVARMVPEIRNRFPDIPAPLELPPEQQRRYFFNAVSSFIGRGAKRFPLLLVMDDVHWADVPTLLLIEHMAELVPTMRVLGVGTYRDVDLDVSRPLAATLERMIRARTVTRLDVKRFGRADVSRMIAALAGKPPPDRLVDAIFEETEGNPFFIEEVFRHLMEEGKILDATGAFNSDVHVGELDVPESVRLVIGRRLDRLGPEARKALAAGSVVGRGFSFSLLEAISDLDPGRLLDVVEDAEAARVIVPEERDGEVYYTFAHELIRQTLLTSVSMLRRQRLHLAVADAMEHARQGAARFGSFEIAAHLLQAGSSADPERTLHQLELAAEQALDAAAFEDALRIIDDALTLIGDREPLRRARLREKQAQATRIFGRIDEALAIWSDVVDVYAAAGERAAAGELCWHMGYYYIWLSRFPEAFASYARGLEIVGEEQSTARAILLASVGQLTGFAGFYEQSIAQLAEAEPMVMASGDDQIIGRFLWGRSLVAWSFAELDSAAELGRQAVEHFRAARDGWGLVDALAWYSFPVSCSGNPAAAEDAAQEALDLSLRLGHLAGEILAGRGLALVRLPRSGDMDEIEQVVRKDLELCLRLKSPWGSQSYAWLADVVTRRGNPDEGRRLAEQAIQQEPASSWSGLGWASLLVNRAYAGDRATVEAMLAEQDETVRALRGDVPIAVGKSAMLAAVGEASGLLDLPDVAAAVYPALAALADRLAMQPFSWSLVHRIAGMAATASGQWEHAERHLDRALEQAETLPNRLEEPSVRYCRAKMLIRRGRPEDRRPAIELLDRARADYERSKATLRVDLVRQLRDSL